MNVSNSKSENSVIGVCTYALWQRYEEGMLPVIPDIKYKSPGEGDLLRGRDPIGYARALQAAGAPVISVVTEEEHYGGSPELLYRISGEVSIPVLRKDFITTVEQLKESVRLGASGILLITAILGESRLQQLFYEAIRLDLEPLVEIHNAAELSWAIKLPLTFLGINNRNILEWETDSGNVGTTKALISNVNHKTFILSESALQSPEDVREASVAGAHGVLVGTAILKAEDPASTYRTFCIGTKQ
jgi:indole-3-glycerol phosphate synthase